MRQLATRWEIQDYDTYQEGWNQPIGKDHHLFTPDDFFIHTRSAMHQDKRPRQVEEFVQIHNAGMIQKMKTPKYISKRLINSLKVIGA